MKEMIKTKDWNNWSPIFFKSHFLVSLSGLKLPPSKVKKTVMTNKTLNRSSRRGEKPRRMLPLGSEGMRISHKQAASPIMARIRQ